MMIIFFKKSSHALSSFSFGYIVSIGLFLFKALLSVPKSEYRKGEQPSP